MLAEDQAFKDAPAQISLLDAKRQHLDSILAKMDLGNTSFENNLLRVLNIEAEKNALNLLDFNDPHVQQIDQNTINTYVFMLEGNYVDLLKTIYALEQKSSFGEVVHLQFKKNKNYKNNRRYLTCRVLLERVN